MYYLNVCYSSYPFMLASTCLIMISACYVFSIELYAFYVVLYLNFDYASEFIELSAGGRPMSFSLFAGFLSQ